MAMQHQAKTATHSEWKANGSRLYRHAAVVCLALLMALSAPCAAGQTPSGEASVHGQLVDENGDPVPRAEIIFHFAGGSSSMAYTDSAGRFEISIAGPSQIHLDVSKPGFFRIADRTLELTPGVNEVSITLNHETEIQEKLEVQSSPIQIDPDTTSHQETLVQHEILNVPIPSSHDLQQSMRTMPQTVADTGGNLHVAGARQDQTEVLLDGFEINDPASGSFNSRINVDAVRDVSIETGGYGAEYAHAGAGIIALNTQSGDDRWRFGTTNFLPNLSFQQGTHFGDWYPRFTGSGPIKKGRIWFSDAVTIEHTFRLVDELPKGQNTDSVWSGDNLFRWQVNLAPSNILLGDFLYNQSNDPRAGLSALSPVPTTTDNVSRRYFVSVKDQIWAGHRLFEFGAAVDTGHNDSVPQGTGIYVISPSSNSGNYFQTQYEKPRRLQLVGDVNTGSLAWLGTHTVSAGGNLDGLDFSQQSTRGQIQYKDASGNTTETSTFSGPAAFRLSNTQLGGFVQDLWRPFKPVALSVGVRTDWDRLIHQHIVEPRVAMNWIPLGGEKMKFTLAWGEHYQPLNLSVIGQGFDQQRTNAFSSPASTVTSGFVVPLSALKQPRSYNSTAEWEEQFSSKTFAGASFLLRESKDGLAWEPQPSGNLLLQNNRRERYIAGEVWVRHAFGEKAQLSLDYTRSRANSSEDIDPTLLMLILNPQQAGPLAWDAPNRIVSSGWTPIPIWGLLLSGFGEYRTGFPFNLLDQQQQLAAPPGSQRFPNYFSLNVGLEKRFKFKGHEWAVRVSSINVTGHNNPDTVANIVPSPASPVTFSGGQHRAFTLRLRLVTEH